MPAGLKSENQGNSFGQQAAVKKGSPEATWWTGNPPGENYSITLSHPLTYRNITRSWSSYNLRLPGRRKETAEWHHTSQKSEYKKNNNQFSELSAIRSPPLPKFKYISRSLG